MKQFYSFLLIVLVSILFTGIVPAQNNILPPQRLSFTIGSDNGGTFADLSWVPAYGGQTPTGYIIYVAYGQTQDLTQFKEYEKVDYQQNVQIYHKKIYLSAGTYTMFVKAYYTGNGIQLTSTASNWIFVTINDNNPDKTYIRIVSQPVQYVQPNSEYHYFVKAETNLSDNCPLVYRLLAAPDGMTIDENTGEIKWITGGTGEFTVSIEVGTTCKIAVDFAYQKFVLKVGDANNQHAIRFTSTPAPYGYVGQQYLHKITAVSSINCPILYEVQIWPPSVYKFDSNNGVIYIDVAQPTTVTGSIKAYMECDKNVVAFQQFMIKFGEGHPDQMCAKITGRVVTEDGTVPTEGIVRAMRLTERNDKYPIYESKLLQGFFSIPVPKGTFILEFNGPTFHQEFYKDAEDIHNAEKIEVKCGDNIELSVVVATKPEPVRNTVSGRVYDFDDQTGIFAMVEFVPIQHQNINGVQAFTAKTDDKGNYNIELPADMTFRAHAVPLDRMHVDQWYDQVQSPLEADLIVPDTDIEGIDFPLKKYIQNKLYGFTGQVVNKSNEPIMSVLQAIPVGAPKQNVKNQGFYVKTNDEGYFTFDNLPLGKYVVLSIPVDKQYVPGYFKMGDIATLKWKQATIIEVAEAMPDVIYTVTHRERTGFKGIIKLSGNVIANGLVLKNNDTPMGNGIPLSGALVFVLDEYGMVSDFAFTDANGHYELSEISEGKSSINVDMYGYTEFSKDYTGDYNKSFNSTVDVELEPESIASVDNGVFTVSAYPVPANDFVIFNLNDLTGIGSINIINMTGSVVLTQNISFENESGSFILNVRELPAGIYTAVISSGNIVKTAKINIHK